MASPYVVEPVFSEAKRRWRAWTGFAAVLFVWVSAFWFSAGTGFRGPMDKEGAGMTFVLLCWAVGGAFFALQMVEALMPRFSSRGLRNICFALFGASLLLSATVVHCFRAAT